MESLSLIRTSAKTNESDFAPGLSSVCSSVCHMFPVLSQPETLAVLF